MKNTDRLVLTILLIGLKIAAVHAQSLMAPDNVSQKQKQPSKVAKGQSLAPAVLLTLTESQAGAIVFAEDFEHGQGSWSIGGGQWQIGIPSFGPNAAHGGSRCAGTNLSGNYSDNVNANLISPAIRLPSLAYNNDRLRLRYWHWYETESSYDFCKVWITTNNGQNWTELKSYDGSSYGWLASEINLSDYAGTTVKIAFQLTSDGSTTYAGWYLDDVSVEYIENLHTNAIEIAVAANGQFTMGTPDGPILLYGHPNPWSSAVTIRIDGEDYWNFDRAQMGTLISPPITQGLTNTAVWQFAGKVRMSQSLTIVKGSTSGNYDTGEIRYTVTNIDNVSHAVGIRLLLDTMLGTNDGAPFRVPGAGAVTTEKEWDMAHIPPYYQAFDDLDNPTIQSQGTLVGGNAVKPNRFVTTGWQHINDTAWEYVTDPGQDFYWSGYGYDSAAGIYWFPLTLEPGATREFVTYYGLGGIDIDIQPPLVVGLSAPNGLVFLNGLANGNPFSLSVYLSNSSPGVTKTAQGVTTTLNLPAGLQLPSGENAVHSIPNMPIGAEQYTSYSIEALANAAGKKTYSLTVTATNITTKTVNKDIYLFGIQTDPPDGGQVRADGVISSTFNMDMDPSTINEQTFTLNDGTSEIPGTVSYDPATRSATFRPSAPLPPIGQYRAKLRSDIKDKYGTSLPYDVTWSFTVATRFTFIHMTDVHIGWRKREIIPSDYSLSTPSVVLGWVEAQVLFLDAFKDITEKHINPDFILLSGDIVESTADHNLDSFKDLLSQLSIPIYIVPGNHDRYERSPSERIIPGNDHLNNFYNIMKISDFPMNIQMLPGFDVFDSPDENTDFGLNKYNYSFEHDQCLFIALDSGSDYYFTWPPTSPKGKGLHDLQVNAIALDQFLGKPKIIFMHHPIAPGLEDQSIVSNRQAFIDYCMNEENEVILVIGGHTHESHAYDIFNSDLAQMSLDLYPARIGHPLFIQTPSAVKDDNGFDHGYRVIDVEGNRANIHKYTPTAAYQKLVQVALGPVYVQAHDSEGNLTGHGSYIVRNIPDSYYTGYYADTTAQAVVLYDLTRNYDYQVKGANNGFYQEIISSIKGGDTTAFFANAIPIKQGAIHHFDIDWPALVKGENGVTVNIDSDGDGTAEQTITVGRTMTATSLTPATGGALRNENIYVYPNPFNPDNETGSIRYSLSKAADVSVSIYDASNRLVKSLDCGHQESGIELSKLWDGRDGYGHIVANGVYFFIIESSAGERAVGKIAVLR